jgi:type IV pilus assembly protein PilA
MRKQKGFSLIELLIVVAIILIIAAIAIPSLIRSRMAANDSSAASSIRTINTAEVAYSTNYPNNGFSQSLQGLGPGAAPGVDCTVAANVSATSACLIDGVIGCSVNGPCFKNGYDYYITGTAAGANGIINDYVISAESDKLGSSGMTNWCSLDDGVVRKDSHNPVAQLTAAAAIADCTDPAKFAPTK